MRTRVQVWGHSLAIRIPRAFAAETGLDRDAPVELTVEDGRLLVAPVPPEAPTLDEMLALVTPENLHAEVQTGPAQGVEAW